MTQQNIRVEGEFAHIGHVTVRLSTPYGENAVWMGHDSAAHQLAAAWMRLSPNDHPMHPRLVGKPGVGKTTLAVAVASALHQSVFMMQGTSDTRPDDLIITPVVTEGKQISYIASPLVTAMITGGVCILDEGNRMSEKSWASLASLLDHRRYVDSVITGVRIHAHPEFRFVTTMNDDTSVYDLPGYIQSRLNPQIFLDFTDPDTEARIIRHAVPYLEDELLVMLVQFLSVSHHYEQPHSVRDGIQIARYAQRLKNVDPHLSIVAALRAAIHAVLGEDALKLCPGGDDDFPGGGAQGSPLRFKNPNLRPV